MISDAKIFGFYVTPSTILVTIENNKIILGILGFVGVNEILSLTTEASYFTYNSDYSPTELIKNFIKKNKIIAPNEATQVYSFAKIYLYIIEQEF